MALWLVNIAYKLLQTIGTMKKSIKLSAVILLPLLILFMECSQNRNQKQVASGIEGQVLLGPMSAVVGSEKPTPDKPFRAKIDILDINREHVTQFETDEEGRFKVSLEPGDYVISPISPNAPEPPGSLHVSKPPYPEEQNVTVKSGEYTQIIVRYDTGIR